jgi:hypothetical protein
VTDPYRQIGFAGGSPWAAFSQNEMYKLAGEPSTGPLHIRVLFAAMGKMNALGHAELRVGELARILGTVTDTGEVVACRRDSVSAAIKEAKSRGLIAPESKARCLVLRHHIFQKSTKDRWRCSVHDLD